MKNIKKLLCVFSFVLLCGVNTVNAQTPSQTARYFNGPNVSDVKSTSAIISINRDVFSGWTDPADLNSLYFEYYKTNQVCIAIYPTPVECLPKKTAPGVTSVKISDLVPNTSYTVVYKKDNTIRCITSPCPDNSFTSLSAEFKTSADDTGVTVVDKPLTFTKNFGYRARGVDVSKLQTLLIQRGFMTGNPTGYFGVNTLKAVKDLQRTYNINPTGFIGVLTRTALGYETINVVRGEYFEGKITDSSTGCYADGVCSISVDGKQVVTTIGWSRDIVGRIYGSINNVGDAENKIGTQVKVYASKTSEGYTLYGNKDFYIEVK
jgi:peptidoglycan hydrolase-like protein with peptidoglycan-binding domain